MDYSELTRSLEDILDFSIPQGITFSANKSYGARFSRSWLLGVNNAIQPNIAYTYSWGDTFIEDDVTAIKGDTADSHGYPRIRRFLSEDQTKFFPPSPSPPCSPSPSRIQGEKSKRKRKEKIELVGDVGEEVGDTHAINEFRRNDRNNTPLPSRTPAASSVGAHQTSAGIPVNNVLTDNGEVYEKTRHRYIASGILYNDLGVESNLEVRLGPHTRMTVSGYSAYPHYAPSLTTQSSSSPPNAQSMPIPVAESQVIAFVRHTTKIFTTTGLFMSGGKVFGASLLVSPPEGVLPQKVQFGGEVVVSASGDGVPGISVGARVVERDDPANVWISTISPISGHCTLSFSSEFRPRLTLASRYEYNIYSKDSTLAFGVDARAEGPFRLRCRCDNEEGASIAIEYTTPNVSISVGGGASMSKPFTQAMGIALNFCT
eukprot:CFRG0097T1